MGSLLTHLPREECLAVLGILYSVLRLHGLLIFSTQGESCLDHLDWYGPRFAAAEPAFRAGVARDGTYFLPYRRGARYGITVHAADALKRDVSRHFGDGAVLVRFATRGWDRHQDVWSYARIA